VPFEVVTLMMVTERDDYCFRHLCPHNQELPEMANEIKNIEQPGAMDPGYSHYKRFHAGSERSQKRLGELNYDPIGELVEQYHEICRLIASEMAWKEGRETRLNAKGQERVFHHDFLDKLLDKKERIANNLIRYGYGRVPEIGVVEEKQVVPFVVNLSSKSVKEIKPPE
jgi:hypothetical protein